MRHALADLVSVVRRFDTQAETDPHASSLDCDLIECLDQMQAVALSRVRHTTVDVDYSGIPTIAHLPMDRFAGTRRVYTVLTSGIDFLHHEPGATAKLSLTTERREGALLLVMHRGAQEALHEHEEQPMRAALGDEGPIVPLEALCREDGWTFTASRTPAHAVIEIGLQARTPKTTGPSPSTTKH